MKHLFIIAILSLTALSGYGLNNSPTPFFATPDTITISSGDSTEYEITIIEMGFETWMLTNAKPRWYYSNDYYQNKNQFLVVDWNNRVISTMHQPPYEFQIDYDPNIDYGLEVNYQLYWYFKFMEHKYNINLRGASLR
jgi:hypothetical protein